MKSFHGNQIIKCSKCDFRSKSERQAEEHNQTKHNGVKYTCNQCDYESEILKELKGHQNEKKHEGMKFQCHLCKYRATLQSNLKIHVQAMHECQTYNCDVCSFSASTPQTVVWHKKAKHPGSTRKKTCAACAKLLREGLKGKSTVVKCSSCSELTHLRCAKNAPIPFYCCKCANLRRGQLEGEVEVEDSSLL